MFQAARKHHLNLLFPLFRANTSASYPVSRFISRPITVLSKGFAKGFFCIKKETVDKIQQFFFDKWAIEERRYHQLLSILLPGLKNGNLASVEQYLGAKRIEAYAAVPYVAGRWELDDASLPQGAVVVLTCEGVLYSWETYRLERYISAAMANDRISGVVLFVNGPGGMITRVDVLEKLIRQSPKPIVAYITGVCASAHFWFVSACARRFVSSPMDEIGSCGVVYTFQSFKEYYAQMGIEIEDIYPDSADLKNRAYRDKEEKQDDTLIKENLSFYHHLFAQAIARNLGVKYDAQDPLFRGQTFFADTALAKGYVDAYGSLEDAILWVSAQKTVKRANKMI